MNSAHLTLFLVLCLATANAVAGEDGAVRGDDYRTALAASTQEIADAQRKADAAPDSAMALDVLASAYLTRAQLSGDYADYVAAERVQRSSLAKAPRSRAPCLAMARLHLSLHRIAAAAEQLARCPRGRWADDDAAQWSLRAEIAFQTGRYEEAIAGYRRALQLDETLGPLAQLAIVHARLGHDSEAAALLDRAQTLYHGDSAQVRAWLSLQQGLLELDRGRWNEALAYYHQADRALPGWWLVREHVAEIAALRGQEATARAAYRELVDETGNPEFMDALAQLDVARGDFAAAQSWVARADAAYAQRAALLPEATIGHSLEHHLRFHPGDARTLTLARRNVALRPSGEARIKLAEALLQSKNDAAAWQQLDLVLRSGWDTAQLHHLAGDALQRVGRSEDAARQHERALQQNPRAARMYALPPPLPALRTTSLTMTP